MPMRGCNVGYNLEPEVGNMNSEALDPELRRVLWACLDYGQPVICFSWVVRRYKAKFGGTFPPSRLRELERLGVLAKDGDPSRGRRYYRIIALIPKQVNISEEPLNRRPPTDAKPFPCPDCGKVLGAVTPAQLQATAWPYHALYSLRHRRALGYESRNG